MNTGFEYVNSQTGPAIDHMSCSCELNVASNLSREIREVISGELLTKQDSEQ
jgi:hypothetical protein